MTPKENCCYKVLNCLYLAVEKPAADDVNKKVKAYIGELKEKIMNSHDWYCGCDHWNGCNLNRCACCGRDPNGERL